MNKINNDSNENNKNSLVKTLSEYLGGVIILLLLIVFTTTGLGIFAVAPILLLSIIIGVNYYWSGSGKDMRICSYCGTRIRTRRSKQNIPCPSCNRTILSKRKDKKVLKRGKKGEVIYLKDKFKPGDNSDNN